MKEHKLKEMSLEEVRTCSIGILNFIVSVCKRNNLTYYLCGGTLLGAVRHGGFIPWDDDIDIMMPRHDYERLFEVWPEDENFKVLNYKNTHNWPFAFGKAVDKRTLKLEPIRMDSQLIGVDVDIFPIDNLPDDEAESEKLFVDVAKAGRRLGIQLSAYGRGPASRTVFWTIFRNIFVFIIRVSEILRLTSVYRCTKNFDAIAQRYNKTETHFCGITAIDHYGSKERNPKSNFSEATEVLFEGGAYPAPIGYPDYLARLYGNDYMELPPVEKRRTHHTFKAYWL